jgi:hypothetical protein
MGGGHAGRAADAGGAPANGGGIGNLLVQSSGDLIVRGERPHRPHEGTVGTAVDNGAATLISADGAMHCSVQGENNTCFQSLGDITFL